MAANPSPKRWALTLYVSGASPHSAAAIDSIGELCRDELHGDVDFQVIDVRDQPERAAADQVVGIPTLIVRRPTPPRRLVGDLANKARLRAGMGLDPGPETRGLEI